MLVSKKVRNRKRTVLVRALHGELFCFSDFGPVKTSTLGVVMGCLEA